MQAQLMDVIVHRPLESRPVSRQVDIGLHTYTTRMTKRDSTVKEFSNTLCMEWIMRVAPGRYMANFYQRILSPSILVRDCEI